MMMPAAWMPVLRTEPSRVIASLKHRCPQDFAAHKFRAASRTFSRSSLPKFFFFAQAAFARRAERCSRRFRLMPLAFRHQLGQRIGFGQGQVQHPGHVLDAHFGGHGAVGDDLRHLLLAVFLHHVINHLLPALVVESVSISGMVFRSGFRNRSNSRLYLMGSMLVMPMQ